MERLDLKLGLFRQRWLRYRDLYVRQGLDDLVAEADALASNEALFQSAPNTYIDEWNALQDRIKAASDPLEASPEALQERFDSFTQQRVAADDALLRALASEQGRRYNAWCKAVKGMVGGDFYRLTEKLPNPWNAVPSDILAASRSAMQEKRMRAIADAITLAAEAYYKPLCSLVWIVSARAVGETKGLADAATLGTIMGGCTKLWSRTTALPNISDFLDWKAQFVRNQVAHPGKMRFDRTSGTLVFSGGTEQRLDENEMRKRYGDLFQRCEAMRAAFAAQNGSIGLSAMLRMIVEKLD